MGLDDRTLLLILEENPDRGMDLLRELYAETLRFSVAQRLDSLADVQECVYDTLTDFYLQRNRFDASKGSLRGYLAASADRKAMRRYWENQKQWLAVRFSQMDSMDIGNWETAEQLRQALSRLPEKDRHILELKYYDGYTAKEIAEKLGMEHEAVKKRLQRALKKLLKLMEE